MTVLRSERYRMPTVDDTFDFPIRAGWSDGLPVVPPTEARVTAFLEKSGYLPDETIARIDERGTVISAEKLAINAVMAGCLPEYMPILAATLDAMSDERYRFNHLASLGSPWPMIIVNGPVAQEIGLNSGAYLFGPGHRPNLTIARGLSLVLRNCAGARFEDTQRGQWGNPMRFVGCIAEDETTDWRPLHVERGFERDQDAVTVVSTYPSSPVPLNISLRPDGGRPTRMLDAVCHGIASWGGARLTRGTYTLLVPPEMVAIFVRHGWSKRDVRDYVIENTRSSVAELKYRGAWMTRVRLDFTEDDLRVHPGDDEKFVHVFKVDPAVDENAFRAASTVERDLDILVVVAGGHGDRMVFTVPYGVSTNAVTRSIGRRP